MRRRAQRWARGLLRQRPPGADLWRREDRAQWWSSAYAVALAAPAGLLRLCSSLCRRLAAWNHNFCLPLSDSRGLSGQVAQVVELGATHASTADDRDLRDHRAVHGEDALDADAI